MELTIHVLVYMSFLTFDNSTGLSLDSQLIVRAQLQGHYLKF